MEAARKAVHAASKIIIMQIAYLVVVLFLEMDQTLSG